MDALNDPNCDQIVMMTSSQVGKTEILNNCVGYFIDQDPGPMLVVMPTLELAEAWSKDRLAPMLRDTPPLKDKVRDPISRNSGNTVRHKIFPGGHITMAGANSAASLASRPIRLVLCDEVDRYPPSAGTEGDPVSLARKRSTTFWNRKLLLTSTPTVKGVSRIEAAFESSTQEHYFVPCPSCGESQTLKWAHVKWDNHDPATARYECEHCGAGWTDAERWTAVRWGEWQPEKPESAIRGFHLNEIYSPWVRLEEMVANFREAKKLPDTLKTWINTALGETWEEEGDTVDPDVLYATRRERYGPMLPAEVLVIAAGIDQQKDRLEVEIVAFSKDLESWSLRFDVLHGDLHAPDAGAWSDLDDLLATQFTHASGQTMRVECAAIDTHGDYTDQAYRFCKKRWARHIFAVRGKGGQGLPPIVTDSRNNRRKVRLFTLGVDTLKSRLYSRLYEVAQPGPGYCHFPLDYEPAYFESLTSEKAMTKYVQGRGTIAWVPKTGTVQEKLDCRVYAMAAVEIRRPKWPAIERRLQVKQDEDEKEKPQPLPRTRRKRGGFVGGFSR